jgi:hypothetical protein
VGKSLGNHDTELRCRWEDNIQRKYAEVGYDDGSWLEMSLNCVRLLAFV